MEVNYSSSVSVSTVDWYGRASTVLFFNQCPFRCPYCQNHELLEKNELIDISVPKQDIIKSIPFVSAVVFSGGEPLLHMNGLLELASFAKEKGLLVGVETNGFFDESIKYLISQNMVDRFFIDLKAPFSDIYLYSKVCGLDSKYSTNLNPIQVIDRVKKSLKYIHSSNIELEIRTTVMKGLVGTPAQILDISNWIASNLDPKVPFVIQQGNNQNTLDTGLNRFEQFSRDELLDLGDDAKSYLYNVWIRSREQGNEKV